jgi:SAM-dependent methyltransferase
VRLVDTLLDNAAVYRMWQAPFASSKFQPVLAATRGVSARRVLDAGCGPGTNAAYFSDAEYVGIDINERYLRYARATYRGTFVCADLTGGDLSVLGQFDTIIVNSVLHHMDDAGVLHVLRQLTERLSPGGRIHIMELVLPPRISRAWLMARLDRGRYARSYVGWETLFRQLLSIEVIQPYSFGGGLWAMVYCRGTKRA